MWLKINYPTKVCSNTAAKSSSSLMYSECAVPETKGKCKPALNAKAFCITDDSVLEDLRRKEDEMAKAKKEKEEGELRESAKRKVNN